MGAPPRADGPEFVAAKYVADRFHIGLTTVYSLCAQGELPSVKIGRSVRIPKAGLDEYLARATRG